MQIGQTALTNESHKQRGVVIRQLSAAVLPHYLLLVLLLLLLLLLLVLLLGCCRLVVLLLEGYYWSGRLSCRLLHCMLGCQRGVCPGHCRCAHTSIPRSQPKLTLRLHEKMGFLGKDSMVLG